MAQVGEGALASGKSTKSMIALTVPVDRMNRPSVGWLSISNGSDPVPESLQASGAWEVVAACTPVVVIEAAPSHVAVAIRTAISDDPGDRIVALRV